MKPQQIPAQDFFITRICTKKLFGHFTYDLDLTMDRKDRASRLALLYGDNGSGKTTLLMTGFTFLYHFVS